MGKSLTAAQEIEVSCSLPNPVKAEPGTARDVYTRQVAGVLGSKPEAVNLQASLIHDFGCADLGSYLTIPLALRGRGGNLPAP